MGRKAIVRFAAAIIAASLVIDVTIIVVLPAAGQSGALHPSPPCHLMAPRGVCARASSRIPDAREGASEAL